MYLNAHTHSTVVDLRAKRNSSEVKLWDSFHTLRQDPLDNLNLWCSEVSARIWWCFLQVHSAIWTCTAGKKCANFYSFTFFRKVPAKYLKTSPKKAALTRNKGPRAPSEKFGFRHLLGQQMIFMKASLAAKAASGTGHRICKTVSSFRMRHEDGRWLFF